MFHRSLLPLAIGFAIAIPTAAWSDGSDAPPLDAPLTAEASPHEGWSGIPRNEEPAAWYEEVLLWIPNRLADLLDVVKVDAGVGPALGGVVRVTKYGQVGARGFAPGSLRVGLMGRRAPVMFESSFEGGVGPAFLESGDRTICEGETGVSIDLLIVGGSIGLCWDEVIDLLGGIVLLDPEQDDLRP